MRLVLCAFLGASVGCDRQVPQPRADYTRRFLATPAVTFQIGGQTSDTTLLYPRVLASNDSVLFVFDQGDFRLKAFSTNTGKQLWAFGRSGGGPGEFRNPWQLVSEAGSDGIWVADAALVRATLIRDAIAVQELSLTWNGESAARLIPLKNRLLATLTSPGDHFFAGLDSLRGFQDVHPFPRTELSAAEPVHRQSFVAISADANYWAAGFMFASGFFVYLEDRLVCEGQMPYGVPLAEVDQLSGNPRLWIAGLAFVERMIIALGRHATTDDLSALDFFDSTTCQYMGSVKLPAPAKALAGSSSGLFVELEDPAPRILRYDVQSLAW
jgi:hypothetical protein